MPLLLEDEIAELDAVLGAEVVDEPDPVVVAVVVGRTPLVLPVVDVAVFVVTLDDGITPH